MGEDGIGTRENRGAGRGTGGGRVRPSGPPDLSGLPSLDRRLEVLRDSSGRCCAELHCGTVFWTLSLFLLVLTKVLRQHSKFVLVSSPTVQLDIKRAFHLPRNSGKFRLGC